MITSKELQEIFYYRNDGNLVYKVKRGRYNIGDLARINNEKFPYVQVNGKPYRLSKLIYIYHNDYYDNQVNLLHKDGDYTNNKIENLFLFTKDTEITKEILHILFYYHNGELIRKHSLGGQKSFKISGSHKNGLYKSVCINYKEYLLHRIIYIYHYGDIPYGLEIDHINRIKDDNRIENLRVVTRSENHFNIEYKGYTFDKQKQRWIVNLVKNNKRIYLGQFKKEEDAALAYLEGKKKYHIIKDRTPITSPKKNIVE